MSRLSARHSREAEKKSEVLDHLSPKGKKWTEEDQKKLLYCLKVFGHKDLKNISKVFPDKSKDEIRKFLVLAHSQARKKGAVIPEIKYWLDRSMSEMKRNDIVKTNNLFHVAQVMKFLSVDGLVESQPSPDNCGGIDFVAAYRVLYQALMGYPLQPVNQATANFITESLDNLNKIQNTSLICDLTKFLKKKYGNQEESECTLQSNNFDPGTSNEKCATLSSNVNRKPLIVYQRKKPASVQTDVESLQPLEVVFQEVSNGDSQDVKCYSIAIGGKGVTSNVQVPILSQREKSEVEEAASSLWKSVGFNPLQLPEIYFQRTTNYQY